MSPSSAAASHRRLVLLAAGLSALLALSCGDEDDVPAGSAAPAPTDSLGLGSGADEPGDTGGLPGGSHTPTDPLASGAPGPGPGPGASTDPGPGPGSGSPPPSGPAPSAPGASSTSGFDADALYGTWEDPDTGLVWQNPSTEETMNWLSSRDFCRDLVLDGHDDWRLPDVDELRSLIRGCSATELGLNETPVEEDPDVCQVTSGCDRCWTNYWTDRENLPCNRCRTDEERPEDAPCLWPDGLEGTCTSYYTDAEAGERAVGGIPTRLTVAINFADGVISEGYIGRIHGSFRRFPVRCVRGTAPAPVEVLEWDDDVFFNPVLQNHQLTVRGGLWNRFEVLERPDEDCGSLTLYSGRMRQYELRNATEEDRAFRIVNRWPPDAAGALHAYSAPVDVNAPLEGCLAGTPYRSVSDPNFGTVDLDGIEVPAGQSVWIAVTSHSVNRPGTFSLEVTSRVTSENLDPPSDASPGDEAVISVGGGYACALHDGEIHCWGNNRDGQSNAPDGPFTQVAAASSHTCGLRDDGAVTCWGADGPGRLTPPTDTTFRQISAGVSHTCGIRSDRTLVCWGHPPFREVIQPPDGTFLQISVGGDEACGIRTNGTIACWRYNLLPMGADPSPWDPPTSLYKQISAGSDHNCALHVSGRVDCWGSDRYGATEAPDGEFVQVSARGRHSCGIRPNGMLECWGARPPAGYDGYHVLRFPDARYAQVAVGSNYACGLTTDDRVVCWGEDWLGQASPPESF